MKSFAVGEALWGLLLLIVINSLVIEGKTSRIRIKRQTNTSELDVTKAELILEEPLMTFGSNLFKQVSEAEKNVIFSPISVHSALSMVLMGTETGSESEKELIQALGYSKLNGSIEKVHEAYAKVIAKFQESVDGREFHEASPEEEYQLSAPPPPVDLWTAALTKGDQKLLPEYSERVKRYYNSSVHPVSTDMKENDELLETVNSWAKQAGFKGDVLTTRDLSNDFCIMLMSAVQVESNWEKEFREEEAFELFYNHGKKDQLVKEGKALVNTAVRIKLVKFSTTDHPFGPRNKYFELYRELAALEFRCIEIPMKSSLTYTIIQPLDAADGKGLAKLEEGLLTQSRLSKLLKIMDRKASEEFNRLQMPKFKFEGNLKLKDSLKSIGIQQIFDARTAEITKISQEALYVSDARHKAFIEVDKKGSKAAAISFVEFLPLSRSLPPTVMPVIVNDPFIFVIRYNKLPLFIGHLVQI